MKWYDIFSNFYDSSLEKLYFDSRKRAIELLDLRSGQVILDVACGTGANFKHIKSTGIDVNIYGTDFSKGMLNRGLKAIEKNEWNDITLFEADARKLTTSFIKEQINKDLSFDRLICVLGLSVIPDWELVLKNMRKLLALGKIGKFGGAIYRQSDGVFEYNGVSSVKIYFEEKEGNIVSLTVHEPNLNLKAVKI